MCIRVRQYWYCNQCRSSVFYASTAAPSGALPGLRQTANDYVACQGLARLIAQCLLQHIDCLGTPLLRFGITVGWCRLNDGKHNAPGLTCSPSCFVRSRPRWALLPRRLGFSKSATYIVLVGCSTRAHISRPNHAHVRYPAVGSWMEWPLLAVLTPFPKWPSFAHGGFRAVHCSPYP
jgi:hypothetical protein